MKNLRKVRRETGMTMKSLAEMIGVSESAISQYETGKRQPAFDILIKLAEIFNVTTDYILGVDADIADSITKKDKEILKAYKIAKQSDKESVSVLLKTVDRLLGLDE